MQVSGFELVKPIDSRLWGEYSWNCRVGANEAVLWIRTESLSATSRKGD